MFFEFVFAYLDDQLFLHFIHHEIYGFFVGGYIFNAEAKLLVSKKKIMFKLLYLTSAFFVVAIYFVDYKLSFLAGKTFSGSALVGGVASCLETVKQFSLIILIYGIGLAIYDKPCFKTSLSDYLIQRSFRIYLFHEPVVRCLFPALQKVVMPDNNTENFICSMITAIVSVIIALIVSNIIDLFSYRLIPNRTVS